MEVDEVMVWNFYCRNAVPFVQEYGLMSERVMRLGLPGVAWEVFEDRLSLIHEKMLEIRIRDYKEEKEREAKAGPESVTMTGDDNG